MSAEDRAAMADVIDNLKFVRGYFWPPSMPEPKDQISIICADHIDRAIDALRQMQADPVASEPDNGISVRLDAETWAELHLLNGDAWLDDGHRELVVDTMLNYALPEYQRRAKDGLFADHPSFHQPHSAPVREQAGDAWISVSERLPDEKVRVVAFGPNWDPCVMCRVEFWGRGRNGAVTWVENFNGDDSSSYGLEEFGITHWLPIPAPPSKATK